MLTEMIFIEQFSQLWTEITQCHQDKLDDALSVLNQVKLLFFFLSASAKVVFVTNIRKNWPIVAPPWFS